MFILIYYVEEFNTDTRTMGMKADYRY